VSCSVPALLKRLLPGLQEFCDTCDATACAVHDAAYEQGGSEADRIVADYVLFEAARVAAGDWVAVQVFNGLRNFGLNNWGRGPWHGGDRAWPAPQEAP